MDMIINTLPVLMFVVLAVGLFAGYPVAFTLAGIALTFAVVGDAVGVFRLQQLSLIPLRVFGGTMENYSLVAIPMFVFMGSMLERSGVAKDLLVVLQILLRRVPGGLALSVTLMGTIMAATTGIIGASVVMMTAMAMPMMLAQKYSPSLAAGTIASSGTLGILIPPSIMLVVMSDLLTVPVGSVFVAAIVPGLLLSSLYMIYIVFISTLRPDIAPPLDDNFGPSGAAELAILVLRSFIPPVFLISIVLGSIFAGYATPTEAAGIGAAGSVLLAALNRSLSSSVFVEICRQSVLMVGMLFAIIISATAFSYVFRALGGEALIIAAIQEIGAGPWAVLFVVMIAIFVLGFFFDWIEITLIVLPVFGPVISALDFGAHLAGWSEVEKATTIWFVALAAINLQTSFLTPPFGFALFFIKGVAPPSVRIEDIYRGVVPFVLLQLLGLLLCIFFPALVLWLPNQMLS